MAARSRLVSVTTSATALNGTASGSDLVAGSAATILNNGSVTVYVGGADVNTSGAATGIPVGPGDSIIVETEGDDVLYGRVATSTCDMIVLEVGVAAA
jgi:hypothetical protein